MVSSGMPIMAGRARVKVVAAEERETGPARAWVAPVIPIVVLDGGSLGPP